MGGARQRRERHSDLPCQYLLRMCDGKQVYKQRNMDSRNRAEAIKFKLMLDGHIRAYDCRTMSGISEAHVYPPPMYAPLRYSPKETT